MLPLFNLWSVFALQFWTAAVVVSEIYAFWRLNHTAAAAAAHACGRLINAGQAWSYIRFDVWGTTNIIVSLVSTINCFDDRGIVRIHSPPDGAGQTADDRQDGKRLTNRSNAHGLHPALAARQPFARGTAASRLVWRHIRNNCRQRSGVTSRGSIESRDLRVPRSTLAVDRRNTSCGVGLIGQLWERRRR